MGQPRLGVFVQVRLGSQRLPGKALLRLGPSTVIEQAMQALRGVPAAAYALLTDAASAPALEAPARAHGFGVRVGPEHDVLRRYVDAALEHGVDTVVRATGDSPLVSAELARSIVGMHLSSGADLSHYLGCPLGTGVEVIARRALDAAGLEATDPVEREHMSTYLYRHRDRFLLLEPEVEPELSAPWANVSVDTREDFERVLRIYADLYRGAPIEAREVARWLGEHPEEVSVKRITY
jgi:spore coat polysaccharide biosynthesis protein SpsF